MEEEGLIDRLFRREETALDDVARQYSRLYKGIIRGVLSDEQDVEECANDVLLAVWNSIPPNRPRSLVAYLCKIARRVGIDKLRHNTRLKRNAEYVVLLSEIGDCIPAKGLADDIGETIRAVLSDYLRSLDSETEILFIRRYIYLETVSSLARRFEIDENRVSVKLYRARKKLKKVLEKEGVSV